MMRLTLEERTTVLPIGEKLEMLARMLGMERGEELRALLAENMKIVRLRFLQTAKSLSSK
jgi:glutamine synthetase adenylyltransferase